MTPYFTAKDLKKYLPYPLAVIQEMLHSLYHEKTILNHETGKSIKLSNQLQLPNNAYQSIVYLHIPDIGKPQYVIKNNNTDDTDFIIQSFKIICQSVATLFPKKNRRLSSMDAVPFVKSGANTIHNKMQKTLKNEVITDPITKKTTPITPLITLSDNTEHQLIHFNESKNGRITPYIQLLSDDEKNAEIWESFASMYNVILRDDTAHLKSNLMFHASDLKKFIKAIPEKIRKCLILTLTESQIINQKTGEIHQLKNIVHLPDSTVQLLTIIAQAPKGARTPYLLLTDNTEKNIQILTHFANSTFLPLRPNLADLLENEQKTKITQKSYPPIYTIQKVNT